LGFVPIGKFGTEGAVGMIAKKLDLPLLLWGLREAARYLDGVELEEL